MLASSLLFAISQANAATFTWTDITTGTRDWTTASNWASSTQYVSDAANELIFFADSTTNIVNATRSITTNVPTTLAMNTLTLNGKGASSGASSSNITIGSSASTWTVGDGTTSAVNLNANFGATGAANFYYTVAANLMLNQATTLFTGSGSAGVNTGVTDPGFVFSGSIGQAATGYGITKSGSSRVTLSGNSLTFTGPLTVNGGTLLLTGNSNPGFSMTVNTGAILRIGNNTATQIGTSGTYSGNISTGTGGTLQLWSSSAQTLSGVISGAGGIQKAYGGTLTLSGANTYTGKTQFLPQTTTGFTVNVSSFNSVVGGTASSSLGAPTTVANGTIDLGSGTAQATVNLTYVSSATGETTDRVINIQTNGTSDRTITANNASGVLRFTSAFTSTVSGTGKFILGGTGTGQIDQGLPQVATGGLDKQGSGTWTLGGSGIFTGPTSITAGTLSLSSATALQNSAFSTASVAGSGTAGLKIATTNLSLGGLTGTNAFDSRFTTALGGPGNTTGKGGYDGLAALTLINGSGAISTYSGNIIDGASGMTLTKTGLGTQFLNGINSYTGLTTVSAGTLGGNGSFTGPVTVANAAGLSPGASAGAFGTMTINDAGSSALTLNSSYLQMDISTASRDLVAVTGNAVINGTNIVIPNATTGVASGTYDLVTYSAKTGTGTAVFPNGSTTLGNATLAVNSGNIQMTVAGGDLNNSVWVGTGTSAAWDTTSTFWTRNGTASQAYVSGDFVTIDDTATATTITSAGTVSPAQLTINNNTKAFTVTATIGGTGTPLVKMGTNTATLGSSAGLITNTYSGGTVILGGILTLAGPASTNLNPLLGDTSAGITLNGGRLSVSSNNVSGARPVAVIAGGGSLFVNKNNNFTTSGTLTGSGTLTLLDGGGSGTPSTYNFNSTSSDFTGGMVLNNAILNIGRFDDNANNIVFNASIAASSSSNVNSLPGLKYNNGGSTPLTLSNRSMEFNGAVSSGIVIQNNNISQPIMISTNLIATGAGAKILMLDAAAGPTNVFSGNITNGTGGGTVSVVKPSSAGASATASTSTWVLVGNNSYTGSTTISTGTLAGIGANAFGNTSGISIAGAGILSLRGDSNTTFASSNVTTTASGSTINVNQATIDGTESKTMSMGALNSTSTGTGYQVNFTGSNNTSLSIGAMSGAVSTATATVTVNNNISSGGALTIASYNSLNTNGGETLILTGTGAGNLPGPITSSATTLSLQKSNGNGTWVLTGSSSFTGATVIQAGTLSINSIGHVAGGNTALGNPANETNGIIRLGNDVNTGTLIYTGVTASTDRRIQINSSVNTATGGGVIRNDGSGILTFTNETFNAAYMNSNSPTRSLTLGGSGNGVIQGVIQNHSATSRLALVKEDAGLWTLSGANTYTGNTTISAGTLKLGADDAISPSSNVVIGSATFDADTRIDTVGTLDVTGDAVINVGAGGALAFADSKAVDWSGGTLNITGTLGATSLRFGDSADDLTSAQLAVISVNGSGTGTYALDENGYLIVGGSDMTPPTLTSMIDSVTGGPVDINTAITFTVTFNEDMDASTVEASDFGNAGTASLNIGAITETSPGVFTVVVTPTNSGSVQLRINQGAVLKDVAGNELVTSTALTDETTITVRTLFDTWANSTGATGGKTGDPDGDGFVNLMEYAFDTNPTTNSAASIAYSGGVVTAHGQPILVEENGIYYAVYGRRVNHAAAGLTYTVQFSAGLNQWTSSSVGMTTVATDGVIDAMRVPFPNLVETQSGPKKPTFFRVQVSE
ncbi:MAG: hypothetical protein RLZZ553_435 [Verrucomicrobiota bacterium]